MRVFNYYLKLNSSDCLKNRAKMKPVFIPDPRINWVWLSTHAEIIYLQDKVDWETVSRNPNAMPLIEQHLEQRLNQLDWVLLSGNPSVMTLLSKPHLFRLCKYRLQSYPLTDNPNVMPFLENHLEYIIWFNLSGNPNAIPLLEKYPQYIEWYNLSANPNAMHLLRQNQEKIHWYRLCSNPNPEAIPLLSSRMETEIMDWECLSLNPNALPLLEQYPENIIWEYASQNVGILPLLEQNLDKVVWERMCYSERMTVEAIQFLEKHAEKLSDLCWEMLSELEIAVPLLSKHLGKIHWDRLCRNPGAIPILEQYPEKIDWYDLSANPNAMHLLFRLDTVQMTETNKVFKEELLAYVFDPERMCRFCDRYGMELRTYLRFY